MVAAVLLIGLVIVIFEIERRIKDKVEKTLAEGERREYLFVAGKPRLLLRRYHNRGAAFNLGQKHRALVAGVSVFFVLLVFVVFLGSLGRHGNGLLRLGLAILLGGAFSNTYDRLKRKYVVDYFSFNVKEKRIRRIVFNLADFCILIGVFLVVLGIGR